MARQDGASWFEVLPFFAVSGWPVTCVCLGGVCRVTADFLPTAAVCSL